MIYFNPYIYILFILLLPFETPGWLVLTLSFIAGLFMDAFSNTPGMHSAATVLIGFIRQYLLRILSPRDGYESGLNAHYQHMGIGWFVVFAGILTLLHHMFLFYLEDFALEHILRNMLKIILSSILSVLIMMILMLVSYKPQR